MCPCGSRKAFSFSFLLSFSFFIHFSFCYISSTLTCFFCKIYPHFLAYIIFLSYPHLWPFSPLISFIIISSSLVLLYFYFYFYFYIYFHFHFHFLFIFFFLSILSGMVHGFNFFSFFFSYSSFLSFFPLLFPYSAIFTYLILYGRYYTGYLPLHEVTRTHRISYPLIGLGIYYMYCLG